MQVQSGSRSAMLLQKPEGTRETCDYPLQLSLVTLSYFLLLSSHLLLTDTHTHSRCDQLRLTI